MARFAFLLRQWGIVSWPWLVSGIIIVELGFVLSPNALAQDRPAPCSDQLTHAPGSPARPDYLLALREAPPPSSAADTYVRLHWANPLHSRVNCVALQGSFPWQPRETWTTIAVIDTIARPNANQWLHRDAPQRGEICYRAYAANELGRSEYSDMVCLTLGPDFPPPTPWPTPAPARPAFGDSSASLGLLVVVAALVAVLFTVAFSRLWLKR